MRLSSVILIGGESKRAGTPKYKLKYQDKTFLSIIEDSLKPLPVKYSVHNPVIDLDYNNQIIDDDYRIGPINGIYNSLCNSDTDYTLITSCDLPQLTTSLVRYLIGCNSIYDKSVIATIDGFPIPTFAIYKNSDKTYFQSAIEKKQYKLQNVVKKIDCELVEIPTELRHELTNINTISDLESIDPFIFTVSGFKNSGKTTLITKLINKYHEHNIKVSVLKHDGHDFEIDTTTDTGKFSANKANHVTVYSETKYQSTTLGDLDIDTWMKSTDSQVIIIEGMKDSHYPKLVIEDQVLVPANNRILTVNSQTRDNIEEIYNTLRKVQNDRYK